MILFINRKKTKVLLLLISITLTQQAGAACCGAAAVVAINTQAAALKAQASSGFSSVNSNINKMEQSIVRVLKDTHTEQMSAQKKISDVATKTQEDLNKANEQIAKSKSASESKKYTSRQYGEDSIPESLCRQTKVGGVIDNGGNKTNIIKNIEKDNKQIQAQKIENYGKQKATYNQYLNSLPDNGRYVMSDFMSQEVVSEEDSSKIATLLDHFIDSSGQNTFSQQELNTTAGQVNQAKANSLSMQKELLKSVIQKQIIYPKVEVITSGEQSASVYSLVKNDVKDRFVKGYEEVAIKNDVGILREVYKNQTVNNKLMFDLLEVNKQILTILTLQLSHTIDDKMIKIRQ